MNGGYMKKKLSIFIMATIFIFSAMIIIAQTPKLNQKTQELT